MNLSYSVTEKCPVPRPVRRVPWLAEQVMGKRVLDLGCYDETSLVKQDSQEWLHRELAKTAVKVDGLDNSEKLPAQGLKTSDKSWIHRGDITDVANLEKHADAEVLVAGEVIEHLPNTLKFLSDVAASPKLRGKTFLFTTPNATAFHNVLMGVFGRESQHVDHLQIYSYKTLNSLCRRAGFKEWELIPYQVYFTEMILTSSGPVKLAAIAFEKVANAVGFLFPLLAGGWIVKVRI